jgi:hypothetical protein
MYGDGFVTANEIASDDCIPAVHKGHVNILLSTLSTESADSLQDRKRQSIFRLS